MLLGIDKLLSGDLLKALCDLGHGDELVIADANFPGETMAKKLIRVPGVSAVRVAEAVMSVLPLDHCVEHPACIMEMAQVDIDAGMPVPEIWGEFEQVVGRELGGIERFEFYERSKKAALIIQTGEERVYGNLLLKKGVVK